MEKKLLLIILCWVGTFHHSTGQENIAREVDELIKAHILQKEYLTDYNLSVIGQIGDHNKTKIIQIDEGMLPNSINMLQDGYGHKSYVEQKGTGNTTHLKQSGFEHEANLWSTGNDIVIIVSQTGEGNQINSYIENMGIAVRSAYLKQDGNFNKIDLSLTGDGFNNSVIDQKVVINQTGNAHEVKAFMEPFSTPMEITQLPGKGGEGMKVNVSTSAFYFPVN